MEILGRFVILLFLSVLAFATEWWVPDDSQFDDTFTYFQKGLIKSGFEGTLANVQLIWQFYEIGRLHNPPVSFDEIFKKYFPIEDQSDVMKVFDSWKTKNNKGYFRPLYTKFSTFDRLDICNNPDPIREIAYMTSPRKKDNTEKLDLSRDPTMVFCVSEVKKTNFFRIPFFDDIRCPGASAIGESESQHEDATDKNELDTYVSSKMIVMEEYLLHEILHSYWMSLKVLPYNEATKGLIDDIEYNGRPVYGPQRVRQLAKSEMKSQAKYNAANYQWFATEIYWTLRCQWKFGEPKNDDTTAVLIDAEDTCSDDMELISDTEGAENIEIDSEGKEVQVGYLKGVEEMEVNK
ncbi:hypothetical protein N7492_006428 [Penicillium capsulatum]|uniref:Uncharacterized protein n=1 Tax=Penicillium capsulatum TaxID=69766 RepID=A0A9W9I077_9EURO|nr:hypothetical protein N7492_006428 [Penicillium capsulatum]KAJ6116268.1 hypothetical protein N7512_005993 [Penicillium capsulatum]